MQTVMKKVKVSKRSRPHYKKEKPAREKGKQSRKGGKGTSLMHAAAKRQSGKGAADSNYAPAYPSPAKGSHNRADAELKRLQDRNDE